MSFIFRAYHAMSRQRSMTTRDGLPTAATYVFVNMLRKLREDFQPPYLAAVFDVAAPTFRDHQAAQITAVRRFDSKTQTFQEVAYGGYKATRAEMPPDLAQQIPYIRRALEGYRIPILEVPGFEADDVIGTLARLASAQGHPVLVVSNDKDMLQLVDDRVFVLNPPKDNLVCDPAKVEEILGVPPSKVVDVMALRGDSVDNIPGAPGIGDKGSVEIIRRFGSVEAALERAHELEKTTYRESLLHNRDVVLQSKLLATIDTRAPIPLDLDAMRVQPPDLDALRALFAELQFSSLLRDLLPAAPAAEARYTAAASEAAVDALLGSLPAGAALAFAIDSASPPAPAEEEEEEGQRPPVLPLSEPASAGDLAVSAAPGAALTVSLSEPDAARRLLSALADESLPKAVHDWKSALHALESRGLALAGVRDDSMLYSYLLDPTTARHSLSDLALRRLNLNLSGSVAEAADITGRLAPALRDEVARAGLKKLYDDIDLPLVPVLARMEQAGVKIDRAMLETMSRHLERDCEAKAREVYELAGEEFNINSPRKLGEVLFQKLGLPRPARYGKGKTVSTAADVLEELALSHDIARKVLDFRQLSKLKSTYVDALPALIHPATGRLHTTFNQAATATGRLSSVDPNLQNIPVRSELGREIRAAFIAEPGNLLLSADYSQIELRLLAHFSGDSLLVEAFARDDDIHTLTASQVFGVPPLMIDSEHRRRAKVVNFGIVYGLSPFGLAQELGIDQSEARKYIDGYFQKYRGVRRWIDSVLDSCRREKRVSTLFGRIRPIPDIDSKNPAIRGFAERTAVNSPLQGTAADLIKVAMLRIDATLRRRRLAARMTLQVHDELLFEVPKEELDEVKALVKDGMEQAHPLKVPLVVELGAGPNWRDLE